MKLKITAFLTVLLAVLLVGCTAPAAETAEADLPAAFENVSPEGFESLMKEEHLLLDVRTQEEYDVGHIADAVLIPVDELPDRISEIEAYQDMPVLVYCRSGNRSAVASGILVDAGFNQVYNLLGGFNAWQVYK